MTCIPESQVSKLGQLDYSLVDVCDINGNIFERKTYVVNLQLEKENFTRIEVIATPKKYALIGRDILNQKKIMLDAPTEVWSIEESDKP